jgi:predicted RNA-binding protein (TIGR00451 family)
MRKLKDLPYILDYLYGRSTSKELDIKKFKAIISKRTGKVKQIFYKDKLFGTFRSNGSFAPTLYTYHALYKTKNFIQNTIIVKEDAVAHIKNGSSVFVRNVEKAGRNVLVGSDVFVLEPNKKLICIGRSMISSKQIEHFKSGLCVKCRAIKDWDSD